MKSFRQFLKSKVSQYEWFTFEIDEYIIYILFDRKELAVFEEANRRGTLGGGFSYELHKAAHSSVGQEHMHVYYKNNQIFALNIDGTAHDRSHGIRIPNKVVKGIKQKLSGFKLPANNFIESAPADIIELFREQILLFG